MAALGGHIGRHLRNWTPARFSSVLPWGMAATPPAKASPKAERSDEYIASRVKPRMVERVQANKGHEVWWRVEEGAAAKNQAGGAHTTYYICRTWYVPRR